MSLHSIGFNQSYLLPAHTDAVPDSFMSNKNAKPIPSSLQTVNIPSLSGNQSFGGSSVIQLPLGNSAGYMCNPYIRFTINLVSAGVANSTFNFKGAAASATACINSLQTYVNSVQIDNIQNADQVYDQLLCHSTSNDWLTHDGQVLLGAQKNILTGACTAFAGTYCVPLIGLLGSQQAFPLFLCNGVMQIQINWNALARMYVYTTADPAWTAASTVSGVQLVYDRISPEQAFVDSVRNNMMQGHKFVYSYSNFQNTSFQSAANSTYNFGLNVSSLRGIIESSVLTTNLTDTSLTGYSLPNGLSAFQVTLDGRNINSNNFQYNYTVGAAAAAVTINQSVVFAELQRAIGRVFDAGISDASDQVTFNTTSFAVGVSAQRVNEGNMAFSGSPVSVVSIQQQNSATTYTNFITFMSDYQLLIDAAGSVEIVR